MLELPCLYFVSILLGTPPNLTYPLTVRILSIIFIVLPNLVEIILVQLADETREVAVLEVLGEDGFREFLVLFLESAIAPACDPSLPYN